MFAAVDSAVLLPRGRTWLGRIADSNSWLSVLDVEVVVHFATSGQGSGDASWEWTVFSNSEPQPEESPQIGRVGFWRKALKELVPSRWCFSTTTSFSGPLSGSRRLLQDWLKDPAEVSSRVLLQTDIEQLPQQSRRSRSLGS